MEIESYFPFWDKLSSDEQDMILANVYEQEFKKGTLLHSGADDCIGLLIVISGQLRVYMLSDEGKELTLYRLFERDMCLFSAACIMPSIQFDVIVCAEHDSTVLHIPADMYKQLMARSIAVSNYTNELMASHFSDVMWLMDQVLNKKLDARISALLLEESELASNDDLTITHEQIANHLGSMREVVTRMLKYFQNEGLVKLGRGNIQLLDKVRLSNLAKASLR